MLSLSNYITVLPSSEIEKNQSVVQTTFPENGSEKMVDDEVFCSISEPRVSASELSTSDCIMLRQRTNFPRKREASTSISEEPKRRGDHDRSCREEEEVAAEPMELGVVGDVPNGSVAQVTSTVEVDSNGNGCHTTCSDINMNTSVASVVNSRTDPDKCHVNVRSIPCLMPSFVTFPKVQPASIAKNMSLEDCSVSSSTSDLSVSSTGTSHGIQEDLDCLHLTDASSGSSNATVSTASDCSSFASPLVPSLFHKVPPTIYFSLEDEKVHPLPPEVRALLKWKLSTITPVLIKQLVERSGYQLVKVADECSDWIGTWGKHMKCVAFKKIKEFQKVNHFPGCFHLGRKDKMTQIYNKMLLRHDPEEFSFYPETFVLPQDIRRLREVWKNEGSRKRWIIKPPASARGTGIKVIHKWNQIPKKRPVIVQRYLSEPYLINDTKFDLRVYVLVPSYDPLRVYIFEDGLVRFASAKYSSSVQTLNEPFMHLTNYSINRKNAAYTANNGDNNCQGHKWSLKSFWNYMNNDGIDSKAIWEKIVDLVLKTIICSEGPMTRLVRNYTKSRYNCFELFGFDIMLDKDLKPWLLEVNISPSLHTSSSLDYKVKGPLAKDMLNIAGFQIPDKVLQNVCLETIQSKYGISLEQTESLCMNKSLHYWYLSPAEKTKHSHFTWKDTPSDEGILDNLTPDDIRHLIESEDELQRCGLYTRIFPSSTSTKYLQYFEYVRYYNILLEAWERRYQDKRSEGIALLQSLCQKNLHLQTVFRDSTFQTT